jgi:hypothetical protein
MNRISPGSSTVVPNKYAASMDTGAGALILA